MIPGKWEVVLWHKNKRKRWIVDGTKREAEAFLARKRLEFASGDVERASRTAPPFSEFCLGPYTSHALTHLKATTWSRSRKYEVAALIEAIGDTKLDQLSTATIEKLKAQWLRSGLSAGTVNKRLTALGAILGAAHDLGYPCAKPKLRRVKERGKRPAQGWTEDEMARLYDAVERKSPGVLPLVVCLANTGMRKGEVIALERNDVDLVRNQIRIWPNDDWQPKDNQPREVPIATALRPWLERDTGQFAFPNSRGTRFAYWPQRAFDRARSAARLKGGPHTLRHTFATHFLASCPDMFLLAKVLGHSHESVTARYAHLLPEHLERARDVVSFAPNIGPAEWTARQHWKK